MNTRSISTKFVLALLMLMVASTAVARPGFDKLRIRTWDRTLMFFGCTVQTQQGPGDPNVPGFIVGSCNASMFTSPFEGLNYTPTVNTYTVDVVFPGFIYGDERCVIRSTEWGGPGNQDLTYHITCFDTISKMGGEDGETPVFD